MKDCVDVFELLDASYVCELPRHVLHPSQITTVAKGSASPDRFP